MYQAFWLRHTVPRIIIAQSPIRHSLSDRYSVLAHLLFLLPLANRTISISTRSSCSSLLVTYNNGVQNHCYVFYRSIILDLAFNAVNITACFHVNGSAPLRFHMDYQAKVLTNDRYFFKKGKLAVNNFCRITTGFKIKVV